MQYTWVYNILFYPRFFFFLWASLAYIKKQWEKLFKKKKKLLMWESRVHKQCVGLEVLKISDVCKKKYTTKYKNRADISTHTVLLFLHHHHLKILYLCLILVLYFKHIFLCYNFLSHFFFIFFKSYLSILSSFPTVSPYIYYFTTQLFLTNDNPLFSFFFFPAFIHSFCQ